MMIFLLCLIREMVIVDFIVFRFKIVIELFICIFYCVVYYVLVR